jgi:pimeloyl-ACP methyl ester carboxylesterase
MADSLPSAAEDRRLAYRHRPGRGPTLIFLPGYRSDMEGAKATALDSWAAAEAARCCASTMPAADRAAAISSFQTLEGWRGDVLSMIDEVAEGPVILVGSSMGGWLMLLAALARPQRVVGLIGIAAAPDFTSWGFTEAQKLALLRDGRLVETSPYGGEALHHHPHLLGERRVAAPYARADPRRLPGAPAPWREGR